MTAINRQMLDNAHRALFLVSRDVNAPLSIRINAVALKAQVELAIVGKRNPQDTLKSAHRFITTL